MRSRLMATAFPAAPYHCRRDINMNALPSVRRTTINNAAITSSGTAEILAADMAGAPLDDLKDLLWALQILKSLTK
ncbi:hypothetical protein [Mycetohabitans endofungorum]|uniref:hypothetical protein n=2 Tax=Mycetohabitans TaxID=2571159 RepID=UPI0011B07C0C|nr:hypothetical protein [Mycetohabitans endofungorum]